MSASTPPLQLHNIGGRRAYAVWGAAMAVYVLGVFHRTSLGVAGLIAADRFHITAAQLATFTVVQLLVHTHDGDACLAIAGENRTGHWRCAAVSS